MRGAEKTTKMVTTENANAAYRLLGLDPDHPYLALVDVNIEAGHVTATYTQRVRLVRTTP